MQISIQAVSMHFVIMLIQKCYCLVGTLKTRTVLGTVCSWNLEVEKKPQNSEQNLGDNIGA